LRREARAAFAASRVDNQGLRAAQSKKRLKFQRCRRPKGRATGLEKSHMHKSVKCLVAAAVAVSALSVPAFAGDQTSGKAGSSAEGLRAIGAVFPSRSIKAGPAFQADPTVASRDTPTAEQAAQLFTLVGHTRDGKEVRKAPSDDVIRSITETRP
jgi:hypothetical protein